MTQTIMCCNNFNFPSTLVMHLLNTDGIIGISLCVSLSNCAYEAETKNNLNKDVFI